MTLIINIKTTDDMTARNVLRILIDSLVDGSLVEGNGKLFDLANNPVGSYFYKKEGSAHN
jgi:hypothetical protein